MQQLGVMSSRHVDCAHDLQFAVYSFSSACWVLVLWIQLNSSNSMCGRSHNLPVEPLNPFKLACFLGGAKEQQVMH